MGKQDIDHSCGHTYSHQLWGPHRDRDELAAWLATTACPDCARIEREREREAEAAEAQTRDAQWGGKLAGSPRQVRWATVIRDQEMQRLHRCLDGSAMRRDHKIESVREMKALLARTLIDYIQHLRRQTEARWWIDHRDRLGYIDGPRERRAMYWEYIQSHAPAVMVVMTGAAMDVLIDMMRETQAAQDAAAIALQRHPGGGED